MNDSGDRWDLFQARHGEWSDRVFGIRPATAPLAHLKKEVKEVYDKPHDIMEFADCRLLLMDAARIQGFTESDVYEACEKKFAINQAREWGEPDKDGAVEHIREKE